MKDSFAPDSDSWQIVLGWYYLKWLEPLIMSLAKRFELGLIFNCFFRVSNCDSVHCISTFCISTFCISTHLQLIVELKDFIHSIQFHLHQTWKAASEMTPLSIWERYINCYLTVNLSMIFPGKKYRISSEGSRYLLGKCSMGVIRIQMISFEELQLKARNPPVLVAAKMAKILAPRGFTDFPLNSARKSLSIIFSIMMSFLMTTLTCRQPLRHLRM